MNLLPIGAAAAVAAAALYSGGVAVQALEARKTPRRHALHPSLLGGLVARPGWLLGTALVTLGWLLQAGALLVAPLTVVQPMLAAGLLLLLAIGARYLSEPVGWREIVGVFVIVAGLSALALAAPEHKTVAAGAVTIALVLAPLGAAVLAPYALRRLGHPSDVLAVVSAGLGYAWCGLATKLAADALSAGDALQVALWVAGVGAAAAVALTSEMTALQRRPATQVVPVILVLDIVVAVGLGALLSGEPWSATPLGGWALALALAVVAAGTAVLAASPAVLAVFSTGAAKGTATGTAETARAPIHAGRRSTPPTSDPLPDAGVTTTTSPARGNV